MSIWWSEEDIDAITYCEGWSNHYPEPGGEWELPAGVSLAAIAPWCVPGHGYTQSGDCENGCSSHEKNPEVGPFVRLDVHAESSRSKWPSEPDPSPAWCHSVIMDEDQARELRDQLSTWLERPKVHPVAGRGDKSAEVSK